MRGIPEKLARFVERRPWWFVIAATVLAAAAVPGVIMLKTEGGMDTMVSDTSPIFRDTERYKEQFGGDSITILLSGELDEGNIAILQQFEDEFSADTTRIHSVILPRPDEPINEENYLLMVTPAGNADLDETLLLTQNIEEFFSENSLNDVDVRVIDFNKIFLAISKSIGNDLSILLGLAIGVMTLILFLIFRVRWRLLSLLMVGVSALWTFGIMGYASVPISMATMAVLPILIGLGIDYSIQFHNRYQEEVARSSSVKEAIITSVKRMFPVVGIALLATIIGFITLYISEVPMIRDFGLMLAIGILLCYIGGLFLLNSILYLINRKKAIAELSQAAVAARHHIEKALSGVAHFVVKWPLPIFLIALATGVAGGILDHWLPVNTDMQSLMPQDTPELLELQEMQEILGSSGGSLSYMVEADDVTDRDFLLWLENYQDVEIELYPDIVSANSPATLIGGALSDGLGMTIQQASQTDVNDVLIGLQALQPAYVGMFISADKQMASVSFNATEISMEQTYNLLGQIQDDAQLPDGVSIAQVGSTALGAHTLNAVVGPRLTMTFLCLGAVFVVLLLIYRRIVRTLFVILPTGLVIGWLSLVMYVSGMGLNPVTAILGILIVGVNTEFMVLLSSRYEEEKKNGELPHNAMVIAAAKMGRAIIATGVTTLAGFGVLIASKFVMISDFGIVTAVGVFLCLLSTIVVMPPLMVWWDEWRARRRTSKQPAMVQMEDQEAPVSE